MQLMTWTLSRLGSRFNLLFEPHQRRVLHSALGRFLDAPLDLMVGLVEPDGTERVLPLSRRGQPLFNCEQFERTNSITFRGYSEKYKLRFEFNIHSVFYPQDEKLCLLPAFYLEMRLNPAERVRWERAQGDRPAKCKLFIRLERPGTAISNAAAADASAPGSGARIDLSYRNTLTPSSTRTDQDKPPIAGEHDVNVRERIVSLNPEAVPEPDGKGLSIELPVTDIGSGIKWRMVWAAHCPDPVLNIGDKQNPTPARFKYAHHWPDLDAVVAQAVARRDENLMLSRRIEKTFDSASLSMAQRHLVNQGLQAYLSNTWWCGLPAEGGAVKDWFSVWEGSCFYHSTVDVEYNCSLFYFALWPELLAIQFEQWSRHVRPHEPSGGAILSHDIGQASRVTGQEYHHDMPVEENCNYLLLLQAHCRWNGDKAIARKHLDTVETLARYLLWSDRDGTGYASEGTANTIDDASPAVQYSKKQVYLAVKRVAALHAAADLFRVAGKPAAGRAYEKAADEAVPKIEQSAWLGDHYVVCVDRSAAGLVDAWSGQPLSFDELPGWDSYSIYTGNGLLLPAMVGRPWLLDGQRLRGDLHSAMRETLSPYGCGHSSFEVENVWISQNLWRDHLGSYLGLNWTHQLAPRYWDLQVMSNTEGVSKGFIDTYINNNLCYYPRGVAAIGYLLADARLVIDRLAPGGELISVEPDRSYPKRIPLLPLADWKAGKIPICVVDPDGKITVEGRIDPVIIRNADSAKAELIG